MTSFVSDWSDWKGGLPDRDGTSNPTFEWAKNGFEHPGKTALRTFRNLYRQSLPLWQPGDPVSQVLNGYDYQAIATSQGATQDPRFLQEDRFLDPIPARFGIRFVF